MHGDENSYSKMSPPISTNKQTNFLTDIPPANLKEAALHSRVHLHRCVTVTAKISTSQVPFIL